MKRRGRRKPNRFLFWPVKFSRDRGRRLERRLKLLLDQRAAMRALEIAARLEMLQVAANRRERDADRLRQFLDRGRAALANVLQHEGPALRGYELRTASRGHGHSIRLRVSYTMDR